MNTRKSSHNAKRDAGGKLRIIGGQWRGRQLQFPAVEGLRPTGDRIRETVFNWLTGYTAHARCLDVFSGSGAMALEALSRGAAHVTALELDRNAAHTIQQHGKTLAAAHLTVHNVNSLDWLKAGNNAEPFDIVFIDPPFAAELAEQCVALLLQGNWLSPEAWIYVEADRKLAKPEFAENIVEHRYKESGQVRYGLYYLS